MNRAGKKDALLMYDPNAWPECTDCPAQGLLPWPGFHAQFFAYSFFDMINANLHFDTGSAQAGGPLFRAICSDYDGTLARDGAVADITLMALRRARHAGLKLIMATGRELDDLATVFPHLALFDLIVVENGGVLFDPEQRTKRQLALPPSPAFIDRLAVAGVVPLSAGDVIVATLATHEAVVRKIVDEMQLSLQIIFNKGALMVLPVGISKGSGLMAALRDMSLQPQEVVGIGDAENDIAFLDLCGLSVAVANTLSELKPHVDFVTQGDHGAGVIETIEGILAGELAVIHGQRAAQ